MTADLQEFTIHTQPNDLVNITANVEAAIKISPIQDGLVTVFVAGSTAGLSFIEYEPGLVQHDIPELLQKIVPEGPDYAHHQTWGDHNGHSHLRSFMLPPSLGIPIKKGKLILGTWQQIVFCEFDEKPRTRTIYCQVVG